MSKQREDVVDASRRSFLERIAATSLVAGAASSIPVGVLFGEEPVSGAAWDMAWVDELAAAKHKAVFDAPFVQGGLALGHADLYMQGYNEIYATPEKDIRAVVVIRHEAVPMFLNDAFWHRYQIGQKTRIVDPATGSPAGRNPFSKNPTTPADSVTLEDLRARGVILIGCQKALNSVASIMAQQSGQTADAVQVEAKAAVLPGVIMMPSGIFAIMRAQEAGCQYIRST